MPVKTFFASAIMAHKMLPSGEAETILNILIITTANSYAEACMIALGISLDKWPTKDGWKKHTENTTDVTMYLV